MTIILPITKQEAFELRKLVGEDFVKKSYSKKPHYYLIEDRAAVQELKKMRKNSITSTVK